MSFHLVDQILSFRPLQGASGTLQVPETVEDFPLSLVVEAIGQLASFIAMDKADFSLRPVAALAGEVLCHREVAPGDHLDLAVEVGAMRPNAMRYGGLARIGGEVAVELKRCTGAMLPMDAFDDPAAVRAHMQLLQNAGAPPREFPARAEFTPVLRAESFEERRATATLEAPKEASFYADHFPRRPVYPATLLLDAKIRIAQRLAVGPDAPLPAIRAVRSVKVRAFTPPGGLADVVVEETEASAPDAATRTFKMEAFADDARVSSAIVELAAAPR